MSRRERTTIIGCAEAGCRESRILAYGSQREYAEICQEQKRSPWKCTRHAKPDEVLRPDNPSTTCVLVASRVPMGGRDGGFLPGLFWLVDGAGSGSGFEFGPGFRAHAFDFPEGTRLVVTTQIVTPEVAP